VPITRPISLSNTSTASTARPLYLHICTAFPQDAQHLAARQAAQIADPVEIREGDYVLLEYPDLGLGALVPKIRTPRKGPFEVTQIRIGYGT
jgi:hypothetical protein